MKRIVPLFLILTLLLSSCQVGTGSNRPENGYSLENEIRAVWVPYYEIPCAEGLSREKYSSRVSELFDGLRDYGLDTVFIHVRAFADSIYPSEIFPFSKYVTGSGEVPDFDPFEVILEEAEKQSVEIHAWLNPFRISVSSDTSALPENSPAKAMLESKSRENPVYVSEEGIYFNPASESAQKLIRDGVREILDRYDVAGVHIDDYFYPCSDKSIDSVQYGDYTESGGKSKLSQWRRDTVSAFVASLHGLCAAHGKVFSVSPAGNIELNFNELYADVALWLSEPGYADIIIPQLYFGFEHSKAPFEQWFEDWNNLDRHKDVRLLCGLGAYKCGTDDPSAGEGRDEWLKNDDVLRRQLEFIRTHGSFSGFAVFSAGSLLDDSPSKTVENERKNFKKAE